MSSAANHRKRSCRSHGRHGSAMRGERRYILGQAARAAGAPGAPLIFRLQAFRRRVMEHRKKEAEET